MAAFQEKPASLHRTSSMRKKCCSHIATLHEDPDTFNEYFPNVLVLLVRTRALFHVLSTTEAEVQSLHDVARLGVDLCQELEQRILGLQDFIVGNQPVSEHDDISTRLAIGAQKKRFVKEA